MEHDCPFCNIEAGREILFDHSAVYVIYDKFPVSPGHALIIPKSHCENYFDLLLNDQVACWSILNDVKRTLDDKFKPDGFNIGINVNEAAGQTISHVHLHLIPRYSGDVNDARGGVRGVIPSNRSY